MAGAPLRSGPTCPPPGQEGCTTASRAAARAPLYAELVTGRSQGLVDAPREDRGAPRPREVARRAAGRGSG
eukprot:scaffold312_cov354-Prasinococcus_capsulatus_cf.AAC.3